MDFVLFGVLAKNRSHMGYGLSQTDHIAHRAASIRYWTKNPLNGQLYISLYESFKVWLVCLIYIAPIVGQYDQCMHQVMED